MMRQEKKKNMAGMLVLLVFAIFMVSILMILLMGTDIVQELNQRDQYSYNLRTVAQYITTRVRQADQAGMISVRSFSGLESLILAEEIDGKIYETRVYCYDGYLRELFCEAGMEMQPEFGEQILPLEDLHITDMDSFVKVECFLDGGGSETLVLQLRSRREAVS